MVRSSDAEASWSSSLGLKATALTQSLSCAKSQLHVTCITVVNALSALSGRFTKSVAFETAKQGPTKVPVSLHWASRIGLLEFTRIEKFAGAIFVVLAAMVLS